MENEKVADLLKSFIFFDILFTIFFCLGGLIEYEKNVFIIVFIVIMLISYYPLYLYVKDYISTSILKEKTWHFKHINTCFVYCMFRIFLVFAYLSISIIEMSAIDVPHAILHLPIFSKIVLFVLLICILMLVILSLKIVPYHHNYALNNINNVVVNATITRSQDLGHLERLRYNAIQPLMLHKAYSVCLTPNPRASDNALRITTFSSNEFELEDR